MDRRGFIRVVGGGVMLAASTAVLPGCSTRYPEQATAPWQGPGDEKDLRRWALGFAILAPSSHNRQPWLVDLREPAAISLYVDRTRLLPMTDPWHRQIMVSQGAFIEALVLALRERGADPAVRLFPEGEFGPREVDARPVARISWSDGKGSPDPLFAQILRRHTAKIGYDTKRTVPPAVLQSLASAVSVNRVRYGFTADAERIRALRELCFASARVEIETPRTIMESIHLTRLGPQEIAHHRDGISINGWVPRLAGMAGAFDRTHPPAPGSLAHKHALGRFEEHSMTAMGFVWLSTPTATHRQAATTRSAEVEAGRAYLRLQLKSTELGLQMHPMSQAPQEFDEMRPHYERLHTLLLGRPAQEETVQMFCRVGYCPEQQHTPRRGVDAIIRA